MNRLWAIKIIVFIFTFLLIFGTLVLVGKIYGNFTHRRISDIVLNQPTGSEIKNIVADNGELYVWVSGGGISDRIVVYDTSKHKVMLNIVLN